MFKWNLELLEEFEDCIKSLDESVGLSSGTMLEVQSAIEKKRKELTL